MIKSWCVNRKAFSWGHPTDTEQVAIAEGMLDYWRYCREFVASAANSVRTISPQNFQRLGGRFGPDRDPDATTVSYSEVESVVYGISFAGHDPVTALMCNTLLCLLPRRDQWQALVNDPSLAVNAVEETLRYESSQISWRRATTQDTTLGNVDVPAGTRLMLNFASANHSPNHFENPDEFDITGRSEQTHQFRKGIHFCLGAGLSRMEARIALNSLPSACRHCVSARAKRLTTFRTSR